MHLRVLTLRLLNVSNTSRVFPGQKFSRHRDFPAVASRTRAWNTPRLDAYLPRVWIVRRRRRSSVVPCEFRRSMTLRSRPSESSTRGPINRTMERERSSPTRRAAKEVLISGISTNPSSRRSAPRSPSEHRDNFVCLCISEPRFLRARRFRSSSWPLYLGISGKTGSVPTGPALSSQHSGYRLEMTYDRGRCVKVNRCGGSGPDREITRQR